MNNDSTALDDATLQQVVGGHTAHHRYFKRATMMARLLSAAASAQAPADGK